MTKFGDADDEVCPFCKRGPDPQPAAVVTFTQAFETLGYRWSESNIAKARFGWNLAMHYINTGRAPQTDHTSPPPIGPAPIFEPKGGDVQFTLYPAPSVTPEIRERIELALLQEFTAPL